MAVKKYILIPLWRIWFYILMVLTIGLLFPFLLISILRKKWYPFFFLLARLWAVVILYGMGFFPRIKREQNPEKGKSYIFVSNHTSMTDIMLMLYAVKNPFVFVGKKELARIPLFGFFYKRTCILVDRKSPRSKKEVYEAAREKIEQGLSICIFPEGGVPEDETIVLDKFKDGAFRLAQEHLLPIVPLTFHDNKLRFSYTFFSGSPGRMRVKMHAFIEGREQLCEDKQILKNEVREIILQELLNPSV